MKKRRNLNPGPVQFLTVDDVLRLTKKSRATLYRWCRAGSFPSPCKNGGSIMWSVDDYNEWSKSLPRVRY